MVLDCGFSSRRISKKETQRARSIRQRIQDQTHLLTRKHLLQTIDEELRLTQTVRLRLRLDRTLDSLHWQFKRASNWKKDQSILELKRINGQPFRRRNCKPVRIRMTVNSLSNSQYRPGHCSAKSDTRLCNNANRAYAHPERQSVTHGAFLASRGPSDHHIVPPTLSGCADGLTNDFIKDYHALLAPAPVATPPPGLS